ncbi:MAG: hypothetical protein AAF787_13820 [Chloroflexota bacterium]
MPDGLRSYLTPPQYDNPEDQRTAMLLWWYLLSGIVANLIPYIAFSIANRSNLSRPIFLIAPVVLIVLLVMLRQGQLAFVRWGFIVTFWAHLLIQVTPTGGIYSNLYFWFFFYILFGGFVFSLKTYYGLVGLFIIQTQVYFSTGQF